MFSSFDVDSLNTDPQYSPLGHFDYQMVTPFRAIGSLAFIIGQYGLISAEYEYVNYNQARFYSSNSSEFDDVNTDIKSSYTSPVNLRAGTEWRIQDFRIRGGFGYNGKPYQNAAMNDGERYSFSGGIGYRGKLVFVDLTYVYSHINEKYYFYHSIPVNPVLNSITSHSIVATLGLRFN